MWSCWLRLLSVCSLCVVCSSQRREVFIPFNENLNGNIRSETVKASALSGYDVDLCRNQFQKVQDGASNGEMWARKVLDSWGNLPPTGHLSGRYVDLGNFDECLDQRHHFDDTNTTFVPQYCVSYYPIDRIYKNNLKSTSTKIRMARVFVETRDPTEIAVGVCVPGVCDTETLDEIFKELTYNRTNNVISNRIFNEQLCTRREERQLDGLDIFAISLFSIIGLLMLLSTMYDLYISRKGGRKNDLLISFSITTNAGKLFHVKDKSTSKDTIDCLNGIRSLSIIWVVYGHTLLTLQFMPLINHDNIWKLLENYYSMVVISGPMAVDTFFLMSGILVTLHVYKEIDQRGRMTAKSILKMYLHRYIRLFPILAATILFGVTLFKYIGDGPYWNMVNTAVEAPCRAFWWLSFLYLQNYVNSSAMCLGHTWYLSTDIQLYILSPLILIPLKRWGKKFIGVIAFLICASCIYIFAIMMTHDFSMKLLQNGLTGDNDKKVMLYYGFHTRAPSWLVGALLGHIIYVLRSKDIILPKLTVLIGWLSSLAVMAAIVWGPFEVQQRFGEPTQVESAFYEAMSRVSWAIALAWIVFACCQGYGGTINSFLSAPLWQPLSRLSYAIYIIHLVVQMAVVGMVRSDHFISNYNAIRSFWSDFGTILSISIVMVLAFESPIIALEKYFLSGRRNAPTSTRHPPVGSVETLESDITELPKSSYVSPI